MDLPSFLSKIPLVRAIKDIHSAPRKYLAFTAFNVISWQCIVGPAMILFARFIGMPPKKVGVLISLMPFTTLIAVFMVPLVTRVGPKKLMLRTWLIRNLIMLPVFSMPFVISKWGNEAGGNLLIILTLGFCLARAFGAGGWLPWLHEVVPYEQRGIYFSAEAGVVQLVNIGILISQGLFLGKSPSITEFLIIYAVGIIGGLASLFWMARVPGGAGKQVPIRLVDFYEPYKAVISDKAYLLFLLSAFISLSATNWYGSVVVLYMRDILKFSERTILWITSVGSFFIMVTAPAWGRYSDKFGSSPALLRALLCHAFLVLPFIEFHSYHLWVKYLVPPMVVIITIFSAAFWTSLHRAMLNMVPEEHRIPYTNMWTVVSGLSLGITPILAGQVVQILGWEGFQICFGLSGVLCIVSAVLCYITIRERTNLVHPPISDLILSPKNTLAVLLEGFTISFGLHAREDSLSSQDNRMS